MESTQSSKIFQIPVQRLRNHPENERIYSPTQLDDLEQSIRQNGLLEPLVATQPFSSMFLGGKAVALLALHPVIRDTWEKTYGER